MLKFNNNNLITGFIKQLLASFALPKYRVYTTEHARYHEWAKAQSPEANVPLEKNIIKTITATDAASYKENITYASYIKDDKIQQYVNNQWVVIADKKISLDNKDDINNTRKLQIKNNIYDTYTHEYLGDFLRFIRDYYNLDLMPLYNCFSNNICNNINLNINWTNEQNIIYKQTSFNSADEAYKIYMIPAKLFKEYTIAIDCSTPVELCCGVFNKYFDSDNKTAQLPENTYQKYNQLSFNNPIVFKKLLEENLTQELIQKTEIDKHEQDLKIFIKLPANNTSSITILEGDYSGYNNTISYLAPTGILKKELNHTVNNFESKKTLSEKLNPITSLQLLKFNTGTSYPFSDTLIEYLSGNVITSEDTIHDNILRAQKVLGLNNLYFNLPGFWDASMQKIFYEFINSHENLNTINEDTLGYIDKKVEKNYIAKKDNKQVSIANINIYQNIYLDSLENENNTL